MGDVGTPTTKLDDRALWFRAAELANYNYEFIERLGYDGLIHFIAYHEMQHDIEVARSYAEASIQETQDG